MTGIVLAYAALGNASEMEEALNSLKDKNTRAAAEIEPEADALLEKNAPPASADPAPDPVSQTAASPAPAKLPDTQQRQQQAYRAAKNIPAQREPIVIWDFTLGESMKTVLEALSARGIEAHKTEEPTRLGTWFYTLELSGESPLPELAELTDKDADSILYILEEFQGKLLSVGASATWKGRKNSIRLKEDLFREMADRLSEKYGPITTLSDNGIFAETCWIPDEKHFISLDATASLDGQVVLKVSFNDLPGLHIFWETSRELNEAQG